MLGRVVRWYRPMARLTCNTRFYRYYSSNSNSNSRRKRLLPHGCGIAIAAFPFVKCEENDNENPDNIEIDLLAEAKVVVSDVELHIAAERGDITAVRKELKDAEVEIDVRDQEGMTPLMRAARGGHADVCELLLKSGADFDAVDCDGWNAFFWAVEKGHKSLMDKFFERCDSEKKKELMEKVDMRGLNCLHLACWQGHEHMIKPLVKMGCDIHAKTHFGETPLHHAAFKGHVELCKLLIDKYACDPHAIDHSARTPVLIGKTHPLEMVRAFFVDLFGELVTESA